MEREDFPGIGVVPTLAREVRLGGEDVVEDGAENQSPQEDKHKPAARTQGVRRGNYIDPTFLDELVCAATVNEWAFVSTEQLQEAEAKPFEKMVSVQIREKAVAQDRARRGFAQGFQANAGFELGFLILKVHGE